MDRSNATKNQPLSKTHKDIADQWHPELNKKLTPEHVTFDSTEKVWWQCSAFDSHVWATPVSKRTSADDKGCPYCSARLRDKKSFLEANPRAADLWHPTRNKPLTAADLLPNSAALVWWQCSKDRTHFWQAEVSKVNRAVRDNVDGLGCPKCKKPPKWEAGSLLSNTHPNLVKEWHNTRNGKLTPFELLTTSSKIVWWKCPKDRRHAYEMAVCNRTGLNYGCPYCSNMRILADLNSLAATHPELAKQWHPTLNGDLKATEVVAGTATKVWWVCDVEKSHVWVANVFSRAQGSGCPFCAGKKPHKTNSLATMKPELAKEWHPSLNLESGFTPETVTAGSDRLVWWQCRKNDSHCWQAKVFKRSQGRGNCPYCNPASRPRKDNGTNH